jgi:IS30 family transposase
MRAIAASIQRAPSTVSREIGRHLGRERYRAAEADRRAWDRGRRPKPCRLAVHRRLQKIVARKLSLDWSPEQITGWLKRRYPGDREMQISHETIYRSLFVQARGVLKKELVGHLRTRRAIRRSKQGGLRGQGRGQIVDAVSIRERPAEAEDRAVPGHREGDLLAGSHNTHIATLVERQSRFTMLVKVPGKDTQTVVKALARQVGRLPAELRKSLTWDRGLEMAADSKSKGRLCPITRYSDNSPKGEWAIHPSMAGHSSGRGGSGAPAERFMAARGPWRSDAGAASGACARFCC